MYNIGDKVKYKTYSDNLITSVKTGTITGHPDTNKLTVPSTLTVGSTIIANESAGGAPHITTITGEGGSTTTNIQQGLTKTWICNNSLIMNDFLRNPPFSIK